MLTRKLSRVLFSQISALSRSLQARRTMQTCDYEKYVKFMEVVGNIKVSRVDCITFNVKSEVFFFDEPRIFFL